MPRVTRRMHRDELDISEPLARLLLREQFPQWANLPLTRIVPEGTVNVIFRLGADLCVRMPRRDGSVEPGGKEFEWLPRLAAQLPLEVPVPVAQGHPTDTYPWFWDVYKWIVGETAPIESIDEVEAARDLAAFVAALQQIDPTGAPIGRGIPLTERDKEMSGWFATFDGGPSVIEEWRRALAAPAWDGPPVWTHGDLDARNWLVKNGRIAGIIDWDLMGVGDPACDVMVAWKLHSSEARDVFRNELQPDDATWDRARGWALSQAVAALAYYTPETNPTLYTEAQSWLELIMSENYAPAYTRSMAADRYREWVESYMRAWNSNDPEEIGALFGHDGRYLTEPYATPWSGRDQIVRKWLERKDDPGETTFDYEVLAATTDVGIVKGQTHYRSNGKTYDNLWEIRLDAVGRCTEFVEWWMERPKDS